MNPLVDNPPLLFVLTLGILCLSAWFGTFVDRISRAGGTPLVVAYDKRALGVINLKDVVKGGMQERFNQLRQMGIRTVMITGDNPLTAATIAREAGVDAFLVPAGDNAREARKDADGLRIIAVHNFQQALHALATLPASTP